MPGENDAVSHRKDGRRIDEHMGVDIATVLEQRIHRLRTQHLRREGRHWTARQDIKVWNLCDVLGGLFDCRCACENGRQADLAAHAETMVNAGSAKVRIDEENTCFSLR